MAWNSLTLTLANSSDADSFEDHLLNLGAVAVTYTDAGDEPILEPELNSTPLWSETNINALFELDIDLALVKASLTNEFGADAFIIVQQGQVKDKAWEREWMDHFKPMRFGKRLWICPENMQIPEDQKNKRNVIVDMDPGLAFGTGTHETTSLCLHWLDSANLKKKTILDYGAGSGVLAIAALKLGAQKATCVDIDIQAIEASLNNAERNQVSKDLVAYLPDDSDWSVDEKYDIILANILASPLIALAQDIRRRVKPGGQIVLSGILAEQEDDVKKAYESFLNLNDTQYDGDWICLSGTLKTPSQQLGDVEQVTHCPNCDESFYINAKDLDRANGEVRCGECNTVFYAIDFIDSQSDENKSNLGNPINTGKIPKAHLITGLWIHQKDGLTPVEHQMQAQDLQAEAHTEIKGEQDLQSEIKSEQELLDKISSTEEPVIEDDIKIPDAAQMHALNDNVPLNLDELESLQKPKPLRSDYLWTLLALLAILALGAQYIHQNRDQLALHPTIGQPLQSAYEKLGLNIEPDWRLNAYQINASTVALNPEQNNELIASFNLSNTANHPQIFPIIRLSLFNRWGERIAYRNLGAANYLPDSEVSESSMLAARGRVDVRIAVQDPGSEAMDFNVEVCLNKSGIIRCQEKTY